MVFLGDFMVFCQRKSFRAYILPLFNIQSKIFQISQTDPDKTIHFL